MNKIKSAFLSTTVLLTGVTFGLGFDSWIDGDNTDLATLTVAAGSRGVGIRGGYPGKPQLQVWLSADRALSIPVCINNGTKSSNMCFDFAKDGNHTLTFTEYATIGSAIEATFLGGTVCATQGGSLLGYSNGYSENVHLVLDGAQFTGWPYFVLVGSVLNGSLELKNGAVVGTTKSMSTDGIYINRPLAENGVIKSTNCTITVSSGAKITTDTDIRFNYPNADGTETPLNFKVRVTGENSEISSTGSFSLADSCGVTLTIDDKAKAAFSQILWSTGSKSHDNDIVVDTGALVDMTAGLLVGRAVGADRNHVSVLGGSTWQTTGSGQYTIVGEHSSFNELLVSNATFSTYGFEIGEKVTASNNVVRIMGPDANFNIGRSVLFGAGANNAFVYDGCSVDHSSFDANLSGVGSALRVENGATLKLSNVKLGANGATASVGCSLFVGDQATLEASVQAINTGVDCAIVLSNGTLKCAAESAFYLGYSNASTGFAVTNNQVVFQGDCPKFRSSHAKAVFSVRNGSVVRFELPKDSAYAEAPVRAWNVELQPSTDIQFSGIEEIQQSIQAARDYVLIEAVGADSKLQLPASVLNAAVAKLPRRCRLFASDDGKSLILRVSPTGLGMQVIVR